MYYLINKQTKKHIPNPTARQRANAMHDKNWDIVLVNVDGWIPNSNPWARPLPGNHQCLVKFANGGGCFTPKKARMWNFDNTLVAYKPIFEDDRITLQPGDHVSTDNMTEKEYHHVAKAFMRAGAIQFEYPNISYFEDQGFFGWSNHYINDLKGLYHGSKVTVPFFTGRLLTVDQVVNAKNARISIKLNLSKTRGVKEGEMAMVCCECSTKKEDTYWDGVEWPAPIGSKVEAEDELGTWREGVVGYQVNDSDSGKMVLVDFGDDWIIVNPPEIRPIDTQKEEWLQKASEVVDNIVRPDGQILHNLYDALKSGELENPKDLT